MTDDPARRRVPFAFLEDIKGRCVVRSVLPHGVTWDPDRLYLRIHEPLLQTHTPTHSFQATYGPERARTAIAFSMNSEFSRVLNRQMDHFNGPAGDNLMAVQQRLDDVRDVMVGTWVLGGWGGCGGWRGWGF